MDFQRRFRAKGVEGEDHIDPQLRQGTAQVFILGEAQPIGVHSHPADLRTLAFLKQRQNVRMHGGLAAGDVDEVERPGAFDQPIQQAAQLVARHVIFPVASVIGEADRAIHVAGIGDREHRKPTGICMELAWPAIVRTAVHHRVSRQFRRFAVHRLADAILIPSQVIGQADPAGAALRTEPFLIDRATFLNHPCGNQRPTFAAHAADGSQIGVRSLHGQAGGVSG